MHRAIHPLLNAYLSTGTTLPSLLFQISDIYSQLIVSQCYKTVNMCLCGKIGVLTALWMWQSWVISPHFHYVISCKLLFPTFHFKMFSCSFQLQHWNLLTKFSCGVHETDEVHILMPYNSFPFSHHHHHHHHHHLWLCGMLVISHYQPQRIIYDILSLAHYFFNCSSRQPFPKLWSLFPFP